jgi:hypothetical protein
MELKSPKKLLWLCGDSCVPATGPVSDLGSVCSDCIAVPTATDVRPYSSTAVARHPSLLQQLEPTVNAVSPPWLALPVPHLHELDAVSDVQCHPRVREAHRHLPGRAEKNQRWAWGVDRR